MKTRRSNDQVGKKDDINVITSPLRKKLKVEVEEISDTDETPAAMATSSKKVKSSVTVTSTKDCFLCGKDASLQVKGRRHYINQVKLFKDYLKELAATCSSRHMDNKNVDTCANCVKEIKEVWDLNQEIETMRKSIQTIVERVAATLSETESERGFTTGIDNLSLRTRNKSKTGKPNSRRQPRSKKSIGDGNSPLDLNSLLRVEFKQDVSWNDDEDEIPPDYDSFEPEQDMPGQLNPEPDVPTSSSNSLRPKRKSRLVAEEFLRNMTSPETTYSEFANSSPASQRQLKTKSVGASDPKPHIKKELTEECNVCNMLFISSSVLRKHKILAHKLTPTSGCNACSRKFFNDAELQTHVASAHSMDFACSECGKQLSSRRNMAIHEVIICGVIWEEAALARIGLQLLSCEEEGCGKKFAKMAEFKRHTLTHSSIKPFSCPTCHKTFKHKFSLKLHLGTLCAPLTSDPAISKTIRTRRSINAQKPRPHRCQYCSKRFITLHKMKIHQQRNHTSGENARAICELCGASISSGHLRHHIRRVHEKVYSNFCLIPECGKAFFSSTELKEHTLRVHTPGGDLGPGIRYSEKTLKCSHCSALFRHPSTLSKHRARVHLTAEPKYACDSCEFKFYSKPEIDRHAKIHSRPGVDCTQCGRHFQHEFRLKMHYERDLCGKRVKNNGEASKKKKIGWCRFCNTIVGDNKWLLRRHERLVHPEEVGAVVQGMQKEESKVDPELDNERPDDVQKSENVQDQHQIFFVVPDLQDEVEVGDSLETSSAAPVLHTLISVQSITQ